MWEQLFTLLLYLFLFPFIDKFVKIFWGVGRHEKITPAGALFSKVCGLLSSLFLTALIVGIVENSVMDWIYKGIEPYVVLRAILGIGVPLLLIIALFFIVGVPFFTFLFWLFIRVGLSSALKYAGINLFLMYTYILLNQPGILENTGTLVLTLVGIIMCLSVVGGSVLLDDKADDYIENNGSRHDLFGVF